MPGRGEHCFCWAMLNDSAPVDHVNPVREFPDDAQIVRNEQHGRSVSGDDLPHQVQRLRLDRHVQCRARLVGDQQRRLVGERHRDHDPLVHSAGKLERIRVQNPASVWNRDFVEQFRCLGRRRFACDLAVAPAQDIMELRTDPVYGVERRCRVLEDHRDSAASQIGGLL